MEKINFPTNHAPIAPSATTPQLAPTTSYVLRDTSLVGGGFCPCEYKGFPIPCIPPKPISYVSEPCLMRSL